jgi:phage virion morphogenesis protein
MAITVRGLDESKRTDEAMAERTSNLTPVLQVLAQDLKTLIDDSFDRSRSPEGARWPPLKPATIKRRRSGRGKGPRAKILVDTARLRNSVTTRALPRAIQFGTNVEYAATHQFGRGPIPARPFLPIDPSGQFAVKGASGRFLEEMAAAIGEYIETGALPR